MPPPHTSAFSGPKLINMLQEWGIRKKIFSITLNNARCTDGVLDGLIEHFKLLDFLL